MKSFLIQLIFCTLGTALLLFSVINYEPPAFFAYGFGVLTGICWTGILGLRWLRSEDDDYDKNL